VPEKLTKPTGIRTRDPLLSFLTGSLSLRLRDYNAPLIS